MPTTRSLDPSQTAQPAPPYVYSEQIGHLLRRTYQQHVALFQHLIPDDQLTLAQFAVLCALFDYGPSSLTDIVARTAVDQATARGVLKRPKTRKLLTVQPDINDRRKTAISLTPAGEELVQTTIPYAQIVSEETFGILNPGERIALTFLLKKVLTNGKTESFW